MRDPTRLFVIWFMGLIKGAVISAFTLLPFFGPWAMVGGALAFSLFCLWLALRRVDCPTCVAPNRHQNSDENTTDIMQGDTCYPKVRR